MLWLWLWLWLWTRVGPAASTSSIRQRSPPGPRITGRRRKERSSVTSSVIIPVRNQPACIRWTLESLLGQTGGVEPFEIIVVDDASTDDTAAVVESFAAGSRLTLLRNDTNQGRARSRNRGARAAGGDHLIFLDADSYAPPTLIAGHQAGFRDRPNEILIGRRIEMGWWNMSRIGQGRLITDALSFEEDQRDSRGLSDSGEDFYARTPWLFLATHNMSLAAETFAKVGGFDEALTGWGYEDNEFAYRAFRLFDREPGHFRYDGNLVCYHMPHLRDWESEWQNTTSVLAHIKNRHRHYDVELLSHPPNHLRLAQTIPYYECIIDRLKASTDGSAAAAAADHLPSGPRGELWIGCGISSLNLRDRRATCYDHARPHTDDNYHLLGTFLPYRDHALSCVVSIDLWRMLNPVDLSAFLKEGLRVADAVHLVMSPGITGDDADRIGLLSDVGYLVGMVAARYSADVSLDTDSAVVVRVRR
jgi:glycosyltransferase involved in cell wall biosynthesis